MGFGKVREIIDGVTVFPTLIATGSSVSGFPTAGRLPKIRFPINPAFWRFGDYFDHSRFYPYASLIPRYTFYRVDVEDFWFCCLPTLPLTVAEQPYARKDITNARTKNMLVRFFIIVLQIRLVEYVNMSMVSRLYIGYRDMKRGTIAQRNERVVNPFLNKIWSSK